MRNLTRNRTNNWRRSRPRGRSRPSGRERKKEKDPAELIDWMFGHLMNSFRAVSDCYWWMEASDKGRRNASQLHQFNRINASIRSTYCRQHPAASSSIQQRPAASSNFGVICFLIVVYWRRPLFDTDFFFFLFFSFFSNKGHQFIWSDFDLPLVTSFRSFRLVTSF